MLSFDDWAFSAGFSSYLFVKELYIFTDKHLGRSGEEEGVRLSIAPLGFIWFLVYPKPFQTWHHQHATASCLFGLFFASV